VSIEEIAKRDPHAKRTSLPGAAVFRLGAKVVYKPEPLPGGGIEVSPLAHDDDDHEAVATPPPPGGPPSAPPPGGVGGGGGRELSLRSVSQTVRVDIRKLDSLMTIVGRARES